MREQEADVVRLTPFGLFASRDTIEEAQEYFVQLMETWREGEIPKPYMITAYYILWNTIARNFDLVPKK